MQPEDAAQPFMYRKFQMVDENKMADVRGDPLRKMAQSGMLSSIYAHMFSPSLMRDIFAKQMAAGKTPAVPSAMEAANA